MQPDGVDIWYYKSDKINLTEFIRRLKYHRSTSYIIYTVLCHHN